MAEEKKTVEESKAKVVSSYTVRHLSNGDIEVADNHEEGTTELSTEGIYKDIEDVSRTILLKRFENAAQAGVFAFYQRVAAEQAAQNDKKPEEK